MIAQAGSAGTGIVLRLRWAIFDSCLMDLPFKLPSVPINAETGHVSRKATNRALRSHSRKPKLRPFALIERYSLYYLYFMQRNLGGKMRGLKLAVALLVIWSLGLTFLVVNLRKAIKRNQESVGTLMNLLEIHSWEVPMPKDVSLEWSFELRDYKASNVVAEGMDDWMDSTKKAKIVFMPTGEETIHRFWLVQANGTSSGRTRVDVCDNPEQLQLNCDAGQFEYSWYPTAERVEDGKTYVICELKEAFPPHRSDLLTNRAAPIDYYEINAGKQRDD